MRAARVGKRNLRSGIQRFTTGIAGIQAILTAYATLFGFVLGFRYESGYRLYLQIYPLRRLLFEDYFVDYLDNPFQPPRNKGAEQTARLVIDRRPATGGPKSISILSADLRAGRCPRRKNALLEMPFGREIGKRAWLCMNSIPEACFGGISSENSRH
ncbi:hypothetical protein THIOKS12640013 [Thiocapsa sp. KS1]|nr:hypothetical protein THIOKS12640013 [Thiocapsa sp. KS1]